MPKPGQDEDDNWDNPGKTEVDRSAIDGDTVLVGGSSSERFSDDPDEKTDDDKGQDQERRDERESDDDPYRTRSSREDDDPYGGDEREGFDRDEDPRGLSRRARRNRSRQMARQQADQQIEALRGELTQAKDYIQRLAFGQLRTQASQAHANLQAAQQHSRLIESELEKAHEANDSKAIVELNRLRDDAARKIDHWGRAVQELDNHAQQFQREMPAPQQRHPAQRQPAPQRPDPRQEELSDIFLDRHPWFNPEGVDEDSVLVRAIDQAIADEGYLPNTPLYWRTLESRLKARGIGAYGEDRRRNRDDDEDDRPVRRRETRRQEEDDDDRPAQRRAGPPTGSGRSTRRPATDRSRPQLDEHQTAAIRAMGLIPPPGEQLEPEDQKKLDAILAQYKANDKRYKAASRGNGRA